MSLAFFFLVSLIPLTMILFFGILTAGLLYGCEVEKPASFRPERKRARTRHARGYSP